MILDEQQALAIVKALTRSDTLERAWSHFSLRPEWLPHLPRSFVPYDDWTVIVRHAREVYREELERGEEVSLVYLVTRCLVDQVRIQTFLSWIEQAAEQEPAVPGDRAISTTAWLKLDRYEQKGELDDLLGLSGYSLMLAPGPAGEAHRYLNDRIKVETWPVGLTALGVSWFGAPCVRGELIEPIVLALAPGLQRPGDADLVELVRRRVVTGAHVLCMPEVREPSRRCLEVLRDFYLFELPALRACAGSAKAPAPLQVLQPVLTDGAGQQLMELLLKDPAADPDPSPSTVTRLSRLAPPGCEPVAWARELRGRWGVTELSTLTPIKPKHVLRWAEQFILDADERPPFVAKITENAPTSEEIFQRLQEHVTSTEPP